MPLGRICTLAGGDICTSCGTSCRLDNRRRAEKTNLHGVKRAHNQRLRLAALDRDNYRCRLRLPGCTGHATTMHLDPRRAGDHDQASLADVVSACAHCHGVVDAPRAARP